MFGIDFKTAWKGAKISTVAVIIVFMLFKINTNIIKSDIIFAIPGMLDDIFYLAMFMWAGFKVTKELKGDLKTAGAAGALAALVSGAVYSLITGIGMLLAAQANPDLITPEMASLVGGETEAGIAMALVYLLIIAIFLVLTVIVNFVTGMAGGYFGQRMK